MRAVVCTSNQLFTYMSIARSHAFQIRKRKFKWSYDHAWRSAAHHHKIPLCQQDACCHRAHKISPTTLSASHIKARSQYIIQEHAGTCQNVHEALHANCITKSKLFLVVRAPANRTMLRELLDIGGLFPSPD